MTKDFHRASYDIARDEEMVSLAKSAAARTQWIGWFYQNEPKFAAAFDLAKAYQLSDDEALKLVVCAILKHH